LQQVHTEMEAHYAAQYNQVAVVVASHTRTNTVGVWSHAL